MKKLILFKKSLKLLMIALIIDFTSRVINIILDRRVKKSLSLSAALPLFLVNFKEKLHTIWDDSQKEYKNF